MEFDWLWVLLAAPVVFLLGWGASRLEQRQQGRGEANVAPRAYVQGLNLLLNEQHDRAIDAFIEALQADPHTTELHFALGALFRRRGEFERAVRVHQHLLQRADLSAQERERAQYALAQDYMKAGLFDRAEAASRALIGSRYEAEAQADLLALHERSREWAKASDMAAQLSAHGQASYATRAAHHACEAALEAEAQGDVPGAREALSRARTQAPQAPRSLLELGALEARTGRPLQALHAWDTLALHHPEHFALVALDYAQAARAAGQEQAAGQRLLAQYAKAADTRLLQALQSLHGGPMAERWAAHLQQAPASLTAAEHLLALDSLHWPAGVQAGLRGAVAHANAPLQRYRCAACGFEARQHYWQCPGCLAWDTYPPLPLGAQ